MRTSVVICLLCWILLFPINPVIATDQMSELASCKASSNCSLIDITTNDSIEYFKKALEQMQALPKAEVICSEYLYAHFKVTTKVMQFVDDLEIKAIPSKSKIQIRSESRVGLYDLGVNHSRVRTLVKTIKEGL